MRKTPIDGGQYTGKNLPSSFPQADNSEAILQGFSEGPGKTKPWLPSMVTNLRLHHLLASSLPCFMLPNPALLLLGMTSQNKLPEHKHLSQTIFFFFGRSD